jgi:hypothetical protein
MNILSDTILPVDVAFHPSWWFKHAGITFDEDFFFNPIKRVESERQMEQVLYGRFGQFGLGEDRDKDLPIIGAIHNAAGYLLSGMLGCRLNLVSQHHLTLLLPTERHLSLRRNQHLNQYILNALNNSVKLSSENMVI